MQLSASSTASALPLQRPIGRAASSTRVLKQGVWAYFLLLLFEGALRKWVLPGLSMPLLIVRDPLAMWLLYATWKRGLLPANLYLSTMMGIGLVGIVTATLLGHGSFLVAIYGARILLFHFPLIFVIGRLFNRHDVIQMGIVTVWIAIPMAVLTALQFYSPQTAWVNRGVGGSLEGGGFNGGALGFFRPPATFSFTNGNTLFFGFVSPFIFYFWLYPKYVNRFILLAATAGLLIAVPLSISRSLLFHVAVSALFTVAAIALKPKFVGKLIVASFGIVLALVVLSQMPVFQTAVEAFTSRFEGAEEWEGGLQGTLGNRYLGGLLAAVTSSADQPFFGYGLGLGSNVGGMLLTGSSVRVLAEDDWGRFMGELGPLLGLGVILVRVSLSAKIALASFQRLKLGDLLPWLLLSFGLLTVPQGEWAQPTSLGFSALIGGLMLASLRVPPQAAGITSNAEAQVLAEA